MRSKDELIMEEVYEEGIFSQMSAKRQGRKAEREAGGTLGLKAKQGLANATGLKMSSKDQTRANTASIAKSSAQINHLTSIYLPKLKKLADRFSTDISKMNVDISMITDDSAREILSALMKYSG